MHEQYVQKVKVYELLADAFCRGLKQYNMAMKYYKKMLFLSWTLSTSLCNQSCSKAQAVKVLNYEVSAYHGLGIVNFYLSDLAKCQYYQDRYMMGKSENDESAVKNAVVHYMVTRMERKRLRYAANRRKVYEERADKFARLPSPAAQSKGVSEPQTEEHRL